MTDKKTQKTEQKQKKKNPLEEKLLKAEKESKEFKEKYLLAIAEGENIRKRMQKEKQELAKHFAKDIILDFLNPIDHLENALQFTDNMSEEVQNWAVGFKMILKQFRDVLVNQNIHTIDTNGKQFDPHLHEAVEMVETDEHPPGIVVKEFVKGYKMGDKTIRPSRVAVSKEIKKEEQTKGDPNEEI